MQGTPTVTRPSIFQGGVFFSPDGKLLILNSLDGAQIRDVSDGHLIRVLKREGIIRPKNCWASPPYENFAFSPNGYLLAIEDADGSIGVWDVQTGNLLKVLTPLFLSECPYPDSDTVLFSPNGAFLLRVSFSFYLQSKVHKVQIWGISP